MISKLSKYKTKEKFNLLKEFIIDYLEEIMLVIAIVSFFICGFTIDFRLGFLFISIGCLFANKKIVDYKKILSNERRK